MTLSNDVNLLHPPVELEKRKHKLKRLVQSPNSFFMDVKCQGCFNITTVFSHSQTVVVCGNCQTVLGLLKDALSGGRAIDQRYSISALVAEFNKDIKLFCQWRDSDELHAYWNGLSYWNGIRYSCY